MQTILHDRRSRQISSLFVTNMRYAIISRHGHHFYLKANMYHIDLFARSNIVLSPNGFYCDQITRCNVHHISLFVYRTFQAIGHVCEECGIILTGELFTLHGRVLCEEDFKVWMVMIVLLLIINNHVCLDDVDHDDRVVTSSCFIRHLSWPNAEPVPGIVFSFLIPCILISDFNKTLKG